ncbi:MAG: hypothetical protein ACRDIY_01250 [Chloroflexota bacterium]
MKTATTIFQNLVRATGLIQIALGILFWTGHALSLIPLHMLDGILFVLCFWTLAVLAARAGVGTGLVAMALVWGLIVVVLGMTQTRILPGDAHWVVQVVHLLVGVGAITQSERLARAIKSQPRFSAPRAANLALGGE